MDSFRQSSGLEAMDSFRQIRGGQQCIFPQILVKINFAIHGICPYIAMLVDIMSISSKSIRPVACLITWAKRSTRTGPKHLGQTKRLGPAQNIWAKRSTRAGPKHLGHQKHRRCFH